MRLIPALSALALACAAPVACLAQSPAPRVRPGIEVLLDKRLETIRGKNIGLVTHPAGVTSRLESTIDVLFRDPRVHLKVLMGPEHGVRGEQWAGQAVSDQADPATGLPVYSLYGERMKPTPAMLKGLDVLVYDIQDVGARSYTYLNTLVGVMSAAAEAGIPVVVLDRPDPLGGERVEGDVPAPAWRRSSVCALPIPYDYGMTPGELALMINGEGWLPGGRRAALTVIPMQGWRRRMSFADTGLPWVAPSPHMPRPESAFYYSATETLGELGVLNEGVGLPQPFEMLGAPWINERAFAAKLNALKLPGIHFRPVVYKPFYGTHRKALCRGVQLHMLDARRAPWSAVQFYAMEALRELYPGRALWDGADPGAAADFDSNACGPYLRVRLRSGAKTADLLKSWAKKDAAFKKAREKYLLYP